MSHDEAPVSCDATADVPEAKAELLHAIYERITVRGPAMVGAKLTQSAYAAGLLVAPVVVLPVALGPVRKIAGSSASSASSRPSTRRGR